MLPEPRIPNRSSEAMDVSPHPAVVGLSPARNASALRARAGGLRLRLVRAPPPSSGGQLSPMDEGQEGRSGRLAVGRLRDAIRTTTGVHRMADVGRLEDLGIQPLINAAGTYTVLGGSRLAPPVMAAMSEASDTFLDF